MKKQIATLLSLSLIAGAAHALEIENWSFTGDSLISGQGTSMPFQWEDAYQLVPDTPGDDARTLTPSNSFFSAQTALSSPIDLTAEPKVRLTIDYTQVDFSTNAAANTVFQFRLWSPGANQWIALGIQDNFNQNNIFARFQRHASLGGTDANAGRLVNGLGPDATARSIVMDMDFSTGEVVVSSPNWQWSSKGPTGAFTNSLPAIASWTTLDRFQTAFNNASEGDTITIDRILIETTGEQEGVYIAAKAGAAYNNVPADESVASFSDAKAGDMLVVTVASNQGAPRPDASKITTSGTAGLEPFTHDFTSVGASAHLWYAPVTSDGTVDVTYSKSNQWSTAGAYLLRSSTGAIELLGTAKNSIGNGGAISLTNSYDFGSAVTGLYLEAAASYDDVVGVSPLEPTASLDFGGLGRRLVQGQVTEATLQTIWTNSIVKNIALMGAAFGPTDPVAPTGVNVIDATYVSIDDTPAGNDLGAFDVLAGDHLAVLISSNVDSLGTNDLVVTGTASLKPLSFDKRNNGPCGYLWYTEATAAGTVDLSVTTKTFSAVAAYQLRPNEGDELLVLDTAKMGSSDGAPVTNLYDFGETSSGLFFESYGAYTDDYAASNPDYEKNVAEGGGDRRQVGRGPFSDVASLTNIWTNGAGENHALLGIAYGARAIPTTPVEFYAAWIRDFDLGADTNLTDDADGDLFDNLAEYAFGGAPDDAGDQGNTPLQSMVEDTGSNYIEYVYFERADKATYGIDSTIEVGTDLVFTNWADGSGFETGRGASGEEGFDAVTNRVPIDAETEKFIRLLIEFTP